MPRPDSEFHQIVVRDVSKRYGGKLAVDHLSFTVEPGKVTGFLGPNGAGKSTTMRLIVGLHRASTGSALIGGKRYADLRSPLRVVGTLLDADNFHPGRTAYNHLLFLAQTQRLERRRIDEVLDMVGLADVAGQRTGGFSLGMQQRLGIAVALLGDPPVLILDEPINGLDPDGILWVRTLMKTLAAQGRTVFVSSHLMSEMAATAENLVVIGQGHLIAECSTADFIASSSTKSVLVRCADIATLRAALCHAGGSVSVQDDGTMDVAGLDAPRIGEVAAAHQVVLHELTPRMASLEDAFIERTHGSRDFQGMRAPRETQPPASLPHRHTEPTRSQS